MIKMMKLAALALAVPMLGISMMGQAANVML